MTDEQAKRESDHEPGGADGGASSAVEASPGGIGGRCLLDADDGIPAARLAQLISEISEDTSCATWEQGIEYEAWSWVLAAPKEPFNRLGWGPDVQPEDVDALRRYSEMAGGWVLWDSVAGVVRFAPMAEWL
jgi:hypothetical protein